MSDHIQFKYPQKSMVLVLHRIVRNKQLVWEDINEKTFIKLLNVVSEQVLDYRTDSAGKKNGWWLTFDDGNFSDYDVVFPQLIERNISATFFLVPSLIGKTGYLNWAQVLEMKDNGMKFGSHSLTHPDMTMLSEVDAWNELTVSKSILESKLGESIDAFSFPFGSWSKNLNLICENAGYKYIFNSNHGLLNFNSQVFPRNSINSKMPWSKILATLYPNIWTRLSWTVEEKAKKTLKSVLGHGKYTRLRNAIYSDKG